MGAVSRRRVRACADGKQCGWQPALLVPGSLLCEWDRLWLSTWQAGLRRDVSYSFWRRRSSREPTVRCFVCDWRRATATPLSSLSLSTSVSAAADTAGLSAMPAWRSASEIAGARWFELVGRPALLSH